MHSEGIFSVHVAMAIKVVQTGMRGCMGRQSQHLIFSPPNTIISDTNARYSTILMCMICHEQVTRTSSHSKINVKQEVRPYSL